MLGEMRGRMSFQYAFKEAAFLSLFLEVHANERGGIHCPRTINS